MSLAASAMRFAWKHSSRRRFLKTLEQSEKLEATPLSGDDSFAEPKTSDKSLQMRILDPVHYPGWDSVDKDFAVFSIKQDGDECRTLVCGSLQIGIFR